MFIPLWIEHTKNVHIRFLSDTLSLPAFSRCWQVEMCVTNAMNMWRWIRSHTYSLQFMENRYFCSDRRRRRRPCYHWRIFPKCFIETCECLRIKMNMWNSLGFRKSFGIFCCKWWTNESLMNVSAIPDTKREKTTCMWLQNNDEYTRLVT